MLLLTLVIVRFSPQSNPILLLKIWIAMEMKIISKACPCPFIQILSKFYLKYGSEEKGSWFCKCSIHLGFFYVKKPKRFVILSSDKSSERNLSCFFDIIKSRRMEHLQSEEPFSSDPYFSTFYRTFPIFLMTT